MFEVNQIRVDHKDILHDVAYDFYSRRMATCSSDQTVKVWEEDDQGKWKLSASWKAHSGSIWRITWAHPEFGQVIATCSFDRTASVWEEVVGEKASTTMAPTKRWVRRTTLVDSRTSVTDIEFAPKYVGLLLATASADGIIRIYEAPDIMNLSLWPVQHEVSNKLPLSCLSWNTSMHLINSQLLAAGSDEACSSTGKVFIFEYNENARKCAKIETINEIVDPVHDVAFAPNVGRSYHILAVAGKDLYIVNIKQALEQTTGTKLSIQVAAQFKDHNCPVWRVCWNVTGTLLASTGDDGCVRIWKMNFARSWRCSAVLKAEGSRHSMESLIQTTASPLSGSVTTKYYKRGTISNPNQVPWH